MNALFMFSTNTISLLITLVLLILIGKRNGRQNKRVKEDLKKIKEQIVDS